MNMFLCVLLVFSGMFLEIKPENKLLTETSDFVVVDDFNYEIPENLLKSEDSKEVYYEYIPKEWYFYVGGYNDGYSLQDAVDNNELVYSDDSGKQWLGGHYYKSAGNSVYFKEGDTVRFEGVINGLYEFQYHTQVHVGQTIDDLPCVELNFQTCYWGGADAHNGAMNNACLRRIGD